jgi:hypothetical protein
LSARQNRFEPLGWIVGVIEPPRLLVVHEPARVVNSSWAFVLEGDDWRTRLLSRWRFRRRGIRHAVFKWLGLPARFARCQSPSTPERLRRYRLDVMRGGTESRREGSP